jgi:CRISPR-associated protein Cmr1
MRKPPDITPPTDITPQKLDIIEQKRSYMLITPLYGGGVKPNEIDPITIVRATEIRGQLRFWWRACRGWKFNGNPTAMKTEEDAIWGKAYKKGDQGIPPEQTIQIVVDADLSQRGEAIKPFYMDRRTPKPTNGIPAYAAFPLQPDQDERKKPNPSIPDLWKGVCFTLTISYPRIRSKEVEAALWAWETFGGIGARTRRGFGALCLSAINHVPYQDLPVSYNVEQWIHTEASKYVEPGNFPDGIPHLSSTMQLVVTPSFENPLWAWNNLINKLRGFRQQKDDNQRSAWPEADAIRTIAGQKTKNMPPGPQKFPRSAFGLPIIFHFTGDNAPADHTLNETDQQGESRERFASPLILRPFLCRDNRAVGLVLCHLSIDG